MDRFATLTWATMAMWAGCLHRQPDGGFVSTGRLLDIVGTDALGQAQLLVEAGCWQESDKGWVIGGAESFRAATEAREKALVLVRSQHMVVSVTVTTNGNGNGHRDPEPSVQGVVADTHPVAQKRKPKPKLINPGDMPGKTAMIREFAAIWNEMVDGLVNGAGKPSFPKICAIPVPETRYGEQVVRFMRTAWNASEDPEEDRGRLVRQAIAWFCADPFMLEKRFGPETFVRHQDKWVNKAVDANPDLDAHYRRV